MGDFNIHEDLIKITEYNLAGQLPNPFLFDDGTAVKKPEDWEKRRAEIYKSAIELQYGTMPPKPEFLEVEVLYLGGGAGKPNCYRIHTGTRANPVVFHMYWFKPSVNPKHPIVVDGDLCFPYAFGKEFVQTFTDNGVGLVMFNRTELAPDIANYNINGIRNKDCNEYKLGREIVDMVETHNCGGQLKKAYPEYTFGTIGAWAWGYSRVLDALELLGNSADLGTVAFTGHSRGAKTALLAGALDERATIVNANEACAGGSSNYRLVIKAITEDGEEKPSEPISNIFHHFPAWMGKDLKEYIGREAELPFDSHYLKAMVAPRVLLVGEAASDIWANPVGSWQTSEAAKEVYKFLGCEENLLWYFRTGYHDHKVCDVLQLVNVIKHVKDGEMLNDNFFKLPFKPMELPYSWKCPE